MNKCLTCKNLIISKDKKRVSCKYAMPDKTVNCLCLDKDGYVSIDSCRENIHFMQDVIAWMPLPEVEA